MSICVSVCVQNTVFTSFCRSAGGGIKQRLLTALDYLVLFNSQSCKRMLRSILFIETFQYIENLKQLVHDNLKQLTCSPSVEMQDIPPDLLSLENSNEPDPDIRNHQDEIDKRCVCHISLIPLKNSHCLTKWI